MHLSAFRHSNKLTMVIALSLIIFSTSAHADHMPKIKIYMWKYSGDDGKVKDFEYIVSSTISRLSGNLIRNLSGEKYEEERAALGNLQVEMLDKKDSPPGKGTVGWAIDIIQSRHDGLELMWGHAFQKDEEYIQTSIYLENLASSIPDYFITLDFSLSSETVRKSWEALSFITLYALAMDAHRREKNDLAKLHLQKAYPLGSQIKAPELEYLKALVEETLKNLNEAEKRRPVN